MAGPPASTLVFLHHAAFCSLEMYYKSPSELLDFLNLPSWAKSVLFSIPMPLSTLPVVQRENVFWICRKRLSNHILFFFIFSHAPHGKHIKPPAKFLQPLLMTWPVEVCSHTSCHHGDGRFLHSCLSDPENFKTLICFCFILFTVSLCSSFPGKSWWVIIVCSLFQRMTRGQVHVWH